MFAQISAPPRAAQSAAVAQVPALHVVPPVIVPLEFNTQCVVPVFPYVKLPLLCAIAMLHARRAVTPIKAMSFIILLPSIVNVNLPGPSLIRHSSRHTYSRTTNRRNTAILQPVFLTSTNWVFSVALALGSTSGSSGA